MNNSEKRSEEVTQPLADAGSKVGKSVGKAATKKATKGLTKAAKALAKKAAAMAAKVASSALTGLVAALLPLLPYILGFLVILSLAFMAIYMLVESPSKNQEYQFEDPEEMNAYGEIPDDDGYYPVENISQGNALTKAFYTYFSDQSYWLITEDMKDKSKPINAMDPEVEAKQIKDKYNREEMFYLSPDALFVLDEKLHHGEFRIPEQLIQPVPYEYDEDADEIKLVDIYDEEADDTMKVKSTKYNDKGIPTETLTEGVWDYGFAPVFHYKEFKEEMQYRGAVTQIEVWDEDAQKKIWVSVSGDEAKEVNSKVTDLGTVWMIDQVASPSGTIRNDIMHEWRDTGESWLPDLEDYKYTDTVKVRKQRTVQDTNEDGEPLYVHKVDGKNVYTTEEEGSVQAKQKFETYYEKEKMTFYKKVEGSRWEKVPTYAGQPDLSDVTGTKYYKEYMESYTTYVPEDVLTSLDIAKRLNTTDEKLLKAITPPEEEDEDAENATETQTDVSNLQLGANGNSQAYMKALENLPLLKKYGDLYGVDPYLMIALTAQEASGSHYDASGNVKSAANIGLMQIANIGGEGRSVKAYNFETGSDESFFATYTDLHNLETNIKWGVMYMAHSLQEKDYDIATALQAYNFGTAYTGPWSIESALEQQKTFAKGVKRSDPNNPLGPYAHGDAYYVPHVLRHYASPDTPVPYVMKKDGTLSTLDNSDLPMGTVDAVNSSILNGQTRGLWSTLGSHIKFGWNELKEGIKGVFDLEHKNTVQFHGTNDLRPRLKVTRSLDTDESWEATMGILAYQEQKPLSNYEGFTEEDFKERFHLMFANPFGESLVLNSSRTNSGINPKEFFKDGDYTSPVEKPKVVTAYGHVRQGDKQIFHPGIDLSVFSSFGGQNILAVSTGVVKTAVKGDETQIIIEHSSGTETIYQYVGEVLVKEGDYVKTGDIIAKGSNSPENSGTFHFALRQNGSTKDPTWIVDPSRLSGGGGIVIDPNAKGLFQSPFAGKPYTVTSRYGLRVHPVTGKRTHHNGIDLVATEGAGAPVRSIADGKVVVATYHATAGNMVKIDHGIIPEVSTSQNLYSTYMHLAPNTMSVKVGDQVSTGTQIGGMGTTGTSTGVHLHFELSLGSQHFNPEEVFDF